MTNPARRELGRGYYAPGPKIAAARQSSALGADLTVTVPGGVTATAKNIPAVGALATAGGAVYLGTRLGARFIGDWPR